MPQWDSERVIRGIEVRVFADEFDGDPSVGLPYGPQAIWAETFDGQPFELTAEEEEKISADAVDYVLHDDPRWD